LSVFDVFDVFFIFIAFFTPKTPYFWSFLGVFRECDFEAKTGSWALKKNRNRTYYFRKVKKHAFLRIDQ
jgi:hypothetical protein